MGVLDWLVYALMALGTPIAVGAVLFGLAAHVEAIVLAFRRNKERHGGMSHPHRGETNIRHRRREPALHEALAEDEFQGFMHAAPKIPLHRDVDSWDMPQLLVRVPMQNEEDIRAVLVYDSSKAEPIYLRVPPHVRTCREAVAWTFDLDAGDYRPDQET